MNVSSGVDRADRAPAGESPWDSQPHEHDYRVGEISGRIPDGLRGVLYRIGPGRLDVGGHPLGHIFDGDGMVSRFAIDDDGVRFRNRYVRTAGYRRSKDKPVPGRGFGTQRLGGPLANVLRFPDNMSNTNVLIHRGALYTLWEGGPPHRLDLTTLHTEGPDRFGGALKRLGAFSAHPKRDPHTGEVFNFGLDFFPRPMIRCYRLTRGGRVDTVGTIPIPKLGFVHDFALTAKHLVFVLGPLVVANPIPVALGLRPFGEALSYRPQLGTTIVLLPRDGGPATRLQTDPLFHFHVTNAYEADRTGETVVELVAHQPDGGWRGWNRHLRDYRGDAGPAFGGTLTRLVIDRRSDRVTHDTLDDVGCEFPQLDPRRATGAHRFTYLASASEPDGNPNSITTIDHHTGAADRYVADGDATVCEPLFAPDPDADAEGRGWLLSVEHQPAQRRSRLIVLAAERPGAGPVAAAHLEHHIPMTFHGAYLPAGATL